MKYRYNSEIIQKLKSYQSEIVNKEKTDSFTFSQSTFLLFNHFYDQFRILKQINFENKNGFI